MSSELWNTSKEVIYSEFALPLLQFNLFSLFSLKTFVCFISIWTMRLLIFGRASCYCALRVGDYLYPMLYPIVTHYMHPRHYASSSSGEAFSDRQLTLNFELWVEIFCVPTCFHVRIPKPCLSVCPSVRTPRKEITLASSISVLH